MRQAIDVYTSLAHLTDGRVYDGGYSLPHSYQLPIEQFIYRSNSSNNVHHYHLSNNIEPCVCVAWAYPAEQMANILILYERTAARKSTIWYTLEQIRMLRQSIYIIRCTPFDARLTHNVGAISWHVAHESRWFMHCRARGFDTLAHTYPTYTPAARLTPFGPNIVNLDIPLCNRNNRLPVHDRAKVAFIPVRHD